MNKVKSFLTSLVKRASSSDTVRRLLHAFWQTAGGVLLAGLVAAHSSAEVKLAITAAIAAGLSAVKSALVARVKQ